MTSVPIGSIIYLDFLVLQNGIPVTGQTPTVLLNRLTDSTYFTGTGFSGTVTELSMTEVDSVNQPGLYRYVYNDETYGIGQTYLVAYYHIASSQITGSGVDEFFVTNTAAQNSNPILIAQTTAAKILQNPSILINSADIASQATLLEVQTTVNEIEANGAQQSTLLAFQTSATNQLNQIISIITPATGANQVTFNVTDQNSNPIPGVYVSLFSPSSPSVLLAYGTTSTTGQLIIGLANGTYNAIFFKEFVNFSNLPVQVTVNSVSQTVNESGTTFQPTPPTSNTCALYCYITDATGQPVSGLTVRAIPVTNFPYSPGTAAMVSKDSIEVQTDGSGYFQLNLLQGLTVEISVPQLYLSVTNYVVPSQSSLDLSTLLGLTN